MSHVETHASGSGVLRLLDDFALFGQDAALLTMVSMGDDIALVHQLQYIRQRGRIIAHMNHQRLLDLMGDPGSLRDGGKPHLSHNALAGSGLQAYDVVAVLFCCGLYLCLVQLVHAVQLMAADQSLFGYI